MVRTLLNIVLTGIIPCVAYEILKIFFVAIMNRISAKSLPFTINGYWVAFHERDGYSAYEFLILKNQGVKLKFRLYQLTNDNRFHFYKGLGFIRGSKISLAYQEANKNRSNLTGTFNLKVFNKSEHHLALIGKYTEFSKDEDECFSCAYELREMDLSQFEKFLISVLQANYIKFLMGTKEFRNACN